MKAIAYRRFGAADDVLELIDMPDPEAGPGEVVVQIKASDAS